MIIDVRDKSIKNLAMELRRSGYSYSFISEKTGISKSTLSDWLSLCNYIPNKETIERIGKARSASGAVKSKIKLDSILRAEEVAKKDIGSVTARDLFMLGLGVYIGEGCKSAQLIRIINGNSKVIRLAINWLKKTCGLTNDNFAIRIHLYPDNKEKECLDFWSKETGISLDKFYKSQVDFRKDKKKFKQGKLPYGTAHLSVKSNGKKEFGVFLARRIGGWMKEVLK